MAKINEIDITSLTFQEGSAPTTPASTKWKLYAKTDGLYFIDDAGTETGPFGSGAVGTQTSITFSESAAPTTPSTGEAVIYVKTDGKLYLKDDAGTETDLTATGAGGSPEWAYDKTDNADAADIQWDETQVAGMTAVTVTGSQTITEKTGVASVIFSGQSTQDYNCILAAHTFSVGDAFAVPIRLFGGTAGIASAGVIFTDGTTSAANGVEAHVQKHSNEAHTRIYTRHGTLTAMSSVSTVFNLNANEMPWTWLRLTYQASNTFRKEVSPDGISWSTVSISDVSKTMTPTHVGIAWSVDGNTGEGIATFGPIVKQA